MMFRYIEPEVAGGLGPKTKMDSTTHPPTVENLHYEFEGWLGDDILESFPCYIVTDRLKESIINEGLTGITFSNVLITKSVEFEDRHPNKILPVFHWAKINGVSNKDDFAIGGGLRLVISERANKMLSLFDINNATFEVLT
jgi:hypothetical protein